ncbi:hypothetical protein P7C71_g1414, partial [Lecanoromycetidae sp. Uapishka_2]
MSFNSKNLIYESNEPAFLRQLRGQHGNVDSARHERPLARPKKQVKDGEEDDQPTYVVEDTQDILSKTDYESLLKNEADEQDAKGPLPFPRAVPKEGLYVDANNESARETASTKKPVAAIGASNKRRLAKVVGNEEKKVDELVGGDPSTSAKKAAAKKSKKVKLSFDEEAV